MSGDPVDFGVIEKLLREWLSWGKLYRGPIKHPAFEHEGVNTTLPGLAFFRRSAQHTLGAGTHILSVDLHALVQHPDFGTLEFPDRITVEGASFKDCANKAVRSYLRVCYPAFLGLLNQGKAPPFHELLIPFEGIDVPWEAFGGEGDIIGDEGGKLVRLFRRNPVEVDILAQLRDRVPPGTVSWCRIYVGRYANGALAAGVALNGQNQPDLAERLQEKFRDAISGWGEPAAYRNYLLLSPKESKHRRTRRQVAQIGKTSAELHAADPGVPDGAVEPGKGFATRTPRLALDRMRFMRIWKRWQLALWAGLLAGFSVFSAVIAVGAAQWVFLAWALVLVVITARSTQATIEFLDKVEDMYQSAHLIPGIVVKRDPLVIATMAPMSKAQDVSPVYALKRMKDSPFPGDRFMDGERLTMVAKFTPGEHDDYWSNFHPFPLSWATGDHAELQRCENKIGDKEYEMLETAIAQGFLPDDSSVRMLGNVD